MILPYDSNNIWAYDPSFSILLFITGTKEARKDVGSWGRPVCKARRAQTIESELGTIRACKASAASKVSLKQHPTDRRSLPFFCFIDLGQFWYYTKTTLLIVINIPIPPPEAATRERDKSEANGFSPNQLMTPFSQFPYLPVAPARLLVSWARWRLPLVCRSLYVRLFTSFTANVFKPTFTFFLIQIPTYKNGTSGLCGTI
jgi:hypothetical protein